MISKDQGAYGADYEYRYGDKLKSVTSNFPDEANVTYKYGGDGKRREKNGSSFSAYKWDAGWNMVNKEDSSGTLGVTYVYEPGAVVDNILAHISGSNPATGYYRYYLNDIIGSVRRVRTDSESSLAYFEYTPYGEEYVHYGNNMRYRFAGKEWDDNAEMYYFPYRYYSPGIARWNTRDPAGAVDGPNLYSYAEQNPVTRWDALGLVVWPFRYGNWCAAGWSAGHWTEHGEEVDFSQYGDWVDETDRCCKEHDYLMQHRTSIWDLEDLNRRLCRCLERTEQCELASPVGHIFRFIAYQALNCVPEGIQLAGM
jgi:RHS repeat-associated protein